MTLILTLAALAAGVGVGVLVMRVMQPAGRPAAAPILTADLHHLVDLMRRAHRAICASMATVDEMPVTAEHIRGAGREVVGRCEALARLALGDGRQHVVEGRELALAVGEGEVGIAMILPDGRVPEEIVDRALIELRQLAAGVHAQRIRERRAAPRAGVGMFRHETPESAALALCEDAQRIADRPTAVVARDPLTQMARVIAVSSYADRRLSQTSVAPGSAVHQALSADQPLVGNSAEELFGHYRPDRRRREDEGLALPMRDGGSTVGVLVVFGRPRGLAPEVRDELVRKANEVASRMGDLLAVQGAEFLAMTDELTGLRNRRAFEAARTRHAALAEASDSAGVVALVCLDLDRFKDLNDQYGHEAGDVALRHVARLLRETLRGGDHAIRMGGEEFALWLPGTGLDEACEVADRVRNVIERTPCFWAGTQLSFTCSAGVAAIPDSTSSVDNLYGLADAALYRAKERGRNRVERAQTAGRHSVG